VGGELLLEFGLDLLDLEQPLPLSAQEVVKPGGEEAQKK